MSERRTETRESSDRRDIPRPALWLNLLLLSIGVITLLFAGWQRRSIDDAFTRVFEKYSAGPSELDQITAELAGMDLAEETLKKELDNRLSYIGSLKSPDFYLSIDTAKSRLYLKSGNDTVRDAGVRIGAPTAVKGGFTVAWKRVGRPPKQDKYVIRLPNGHDIHSSPAGDGPMKKPKPGSFMVSEADLQAIWEYITPATRVYVF